MNELAYISPTDLAEATGDYGAIRTPYGDACRKRDAINAVRDRYERERDALLAKASAEIKRIQREGVQR